MVGGAAVSVGEGNGVLVGLGDGAIVVVGNGNGVGGVLNVAVARGLGNMGRSLLFA